MTIGDTVRVVYDERGGELRLVRTLGRGGQGEVWATADGRRAVKILNDTSPARQSQLADQLRKVRRLPLDGLPIARPQLLLARPAVGYVMSLAEGMTALRDLMFLGPRRGPVDWYMEGGGLRRRLKLLARAAEVLAELHGRAIAYGDPSPNNVLVSKDVGHAEIFLIDADNLVVTSRPEHAVYTPFYGAPEVVRLESGITTLSDAHAFAVLTFETLAIAHPLIGDAVNSGEPELESAALAGELPWIDDAASDANRSSSGFPRQLVLTRRLRELAEATFGAGLRAPSRRPGVAAWAEHLRHAEDLTVTCSSCDSTFYGTAAECGWCGVEPGPMAVVEVLLGHGRGGKPLRSSTRLGAVFLSPEEERGIPRRLTSGVTGDDSAVLQATLNNGNVIIKNVELEALRVRSSRQEYEIAPGREVRLPLGSDLRLVFGNPDTVHRYLVVRGVGNAS
jgi:DNA-binding helix-hairpin-helix protein with protein kinase domain